MSIVSDYRRAWLNLGSELEALGLALIDSDTEMAQACFNLAADIDDAYGITSAENKALIAEALAEFPLAAASLSAVTRDELGL